MRYAARVSYLGTGYSGWQRQAQGRGVQEEVENALHSVTGKDVPVTAAGRTDAGVHALGQIISFTLEKEWIPDRLLMALNFHLPEDVSITGLWAVPGTFDARRSALWREYRYFIWHGNAPAPLLRGRAWWNKQRWDNARARAACALYVGSHDFRAFCRTAECPDRTTRTILRATLHRQGNLSVFAVRGNAFLTNMVRIMVGNIDAVGRGREDLSWISDLLSGRCRDESAMTAPAEGLYLWQVGYGEGIPFSPKRVQ